ncbi:PEP-CTERM sorting domain-containing protein [Methylophilus flavus]|jgi:hypothetical protein|uniref:PEP-CTERM sorting domain-containing protein n=1 Tax=Methylophilus flavus TaxID=640084 RepID=A0ABW3PA95_9PROT
MKKISLLFALLLISVNASAASSAGASLSNFKLEIISGDAVIPYLDTLSIDINNNVSNQFLTSAYDHTHSVGLPFSLNLTTTDGLSSSTGIATGSSQLQSLSASANTSGGSANSDVSGNMALAYKAFTLLSFSADALVYGSADNLNVDNSNSRAQISLSTSSFDDAFSTTSIYSDLTSGSGLFESGDYSSSKRIKFFFYDDKDSFIRLAATVNASAYSIPAVTPVPEPESVAMLLAGLGLLGIAVRKKQA